MCLVDLSYSEIIEQILTLMILLDEECSTDTLQIMLIESYDPPKLT